jgi:hypothetical protein
LVNGGVPIVGDSPGTASNLVAGIPLVSAPGPALWGIFM